MLDYAELLQVRSEEREYSWTDREVMLYALAVGYGSDPLDEAELQFVSESSLRVIPTFATVAAWGSNPPLAPMKVNYAMVVHGEQGVTLHDPLPVSGRVKACGRVVAAVDRGPKGAVVFTETVLRDAESDALLATLNSTIHARADGGFGGPSQPLVRQHQRPQRAPDVTVQLPTRGDQALLYRLLGDRNPLHVNPAVAKTAGFERPILHGLCTYGMTCRAVLQSFAANCPEAIHSHHARFAAPVFPGETLLVDLWRDADVISFEARVRERGFVVVKDGKSVLR
jgi:acyl dehydratase